MSSNHQGLRGTRQRSAIKRVLAEAGRPLGPKEILESASREVPRLGIATVYRNIKLMLSAGEIDAVDIPGQPPRYALTGLNNRPLFVSEDTGRVYYLNIDTSFLDQLPPSEYDVDHHRVIFYGHAPEDAATEANGDWTPPSRLEQVAGNGHSKGNGHGHHSVHHRLGL